MAEDLLLKTLVVGLGNPVLGDDEAGWRVADAEFSFRKQASGNAYTE